jgi:hypothetical protein
MPYKCAETPRVFQTISSGGLCNSWNIFSQELLIKNVKYADNINKLVYTEVLNQAEPIINSSQNPDKRIQQNINVSLMLVEFLYYIYTEFRNEINKLKDNYKSVESLTNYYMSNYEEKDNEYYVMLESLKKTFADDYESIEQYINLYMETERDKALERNTNDAKYQYNYMQSLYKTRALNSDASNYINSTFAPIDDMSMFLTEVIDSGL